ncbi:MAG: pilus assembly FimT family protein [Thermoguttaceae bacterium]
MNSFAKKWHRGFTITQLVVVVAIISLIIGIPLMLGVPRPVVPRNTPDESDRVFYREGNIAYSIVCPKDWYTSSEAHVRSYSDTNVYSSSHPLGRIYVQGIVVEPEEYRKATQLLEKTTFQDKEAFKETVVSPPRKMFGPSGYSFQIHFSQDGVWYQLTYFVNKKLKEFPPPIILDYFNTFRIEEQQQESKP